MQEASSGSGDTMQIPHGLTQKPDFIIGKDIDTGSTNWGIYHVSLGAGNKIELDSTGAAAANANYWANTEPTSSVIYTNAASWMYTSSSFVMYSWHNVPGLQKFGSYEGNADDDGPFIYTGHRPRIIWMKGIDSTKDWVVVDSGRDPYNVANKKLYLNSNTTESSSANGQIDILSNGFKLRKSHAMNNAAETFIYASWADQPLHNLYGGQSNAR